MEPRVPRSFHLSILASVLRALILRLGWVLPYCGSFFTSLSLTSLYLFSGIREGGDIPAGSAAVWWSPRSGGLLHYSLRGYLREDRHADTDLRCATSRGTVFVKHRLNMELDFQSSFGLLCTAVLVLIG